MARWLKVAIALFCLAIHAAVHAACSQAVGQPLVVSASSIAQSRELARCIDLGAGLGLDLVVDSTLVRARGLIRADFYDGNGRALEPWISGPLIGGFQGLSFRPVLAVPASAIRAVVSVRTQGLRDGAQGRLTVRYLGARVIAPLSFVVADQTVALGSHSIRWGVIQPVGAVQGAKLEMLDVEGRAIYTRRFNTSPGAVSYLDLPFYGFGYFSVRVSFGYDAGASWSIERPVAWIAESSAPRDPRIGVDAALSWYGGDEAGIEQALQRLKQAGVGSVRDRFNWSQVQPSAFGPIQWGRYRDIARRVSESGFEQTTTFHDSPKWARPSDSVVAGDRRPPSDLAAVERLGGAFARDMGSYFGTVEFWNEQNSDFFLGTPWQYANGMKAFSSGVRANSSTLRVAVGAAAGRPGEFFDGLFRNNISGYSDLSNQHYYGNPDSFLEFVGKYVGRGDAPSGLVASPSVLTETGYSLKRDTKGAIGDSARAQADHVVKAFATGFGAGYERVFYFFLRELIEDDYHNWGLLNSDFSPRPGYVALAVLARQIGGRPVAAIKRDGASTVVFFRSTAGGYVAAAWGKGPVVAAVGASKGDVIDVFGRSKVLAGLALSDSPLWISGISVLPAGAVAVVAPRRVPSVAKALRLAVAHEIDGVLDQSVTNRSSVPVADGGVVRMHGTVALASGQVLPVASVNYSCVGSEGLIPVGRQNGNLKLDAGGSASFSCAYQAELERVGRGHISATVESGRELDSGYISLTADAGTVTTSGARDIRSVDGCPRWVAGSSKNIRVSLAPGPQIGSSCAPLRVTSEVVESGETWVFPFFTPAGGKISGTGLLVDVRNIPGYSPAPRAFLAQITEKGGAVWLIQLSKRDESAQGGNYSGLFALARLAPWSPVKKAALDLSEVATLSFGWGGYAGHRGQRFAYQLDRFAVLD